MGAHMPYRGARLRRAVGRASRPARYTRPMPLTRRALFASTLAAGAAFAARPALAAPARTRRLRIAHLTDLHIQPELEAARGVAACLEHVQSVRERLGTDAPDLIVTGGDTIMDAMFAEQQRAKLQWELWRKVKADHCSLEVQSVIGNHDVWGWGQDNAKTDGTEPLYGKRWACDEFGRDTPYKSFDRGGWHIVLLDSTFPHKRSYIGRLDDEQWAWFEADLAAVPAETPVAIFSHIPILSALPFAVNGPVAAGAGAVNVPGARMHVDADRFQKLFATRRNVKACVSGHMHLVEQVDYGGVRYLCNGAVCSGWWRGLHRDTPFGYALVDLFDDGTVERQYIPYAWQAT
jgi:Icc protein